MIDREAQALAIGEVAQLLGVREPRRERLHHYHVFARQQGGLGQLEMSEARSGDDHAVDVGRAQHFVRAVRDRGNPIFATDTRRALVAHVAHRLELAERMAREVARQVGPPVAAPDDAYAYGAH